MNCRWWRLRLANDDTELRWAPYRILDQWRHTYGGNLLIALPDAFGTKPFLRDAPDWVADWTGFRPDSAPPITAGEEIIKWWKQKGRDPREKLLVFSDGMDVELDRGDLSSTSPAGFASASAGAPTSPMISSAARRMALPISIRSRWSAR